MKFLLIIFVMGNANPVGTYADQGQCLHAAAYLPETVESVCIPAPSEEDE